MATPNYLENAKFDRRNCRCDEKQLVGRRAEDDAMVIGLDDGG